MWEMIRQWFSEPTNQILILSTAVALGIGLVLGGWIWKRMAQKEKSGRSKGDAAFFKGIRYVFSNDRDQAIEAFTKSVQINSDTIETYVALGNLYRSKGDIDRAVRIRQSIILWPNIDEQIKLRALFDLGLDYKKGGFLKRSLETFLKVEQRDSKNIDVLEEIERIYEELKDWDNAFGTRKKIARLTKKDDRHILAHQLVESGKLFQQKGDLDEAMAHFKKALSMHSGCIDAYLHTGDVHFMKGRYAQAVSSWKKVAAMAPHFTFLAYRRLEGAYARMKDLKPVEKFLTECASSYSDAFTHMALARYLYNKNAFDEALEQISNALELDPSLWMARKFRGEILLAQGREQEALGDYKELITHLNVPYLTFQCKQCGFETGELYWQCPQCRNWDTIHLVKQKSDV